MIRPIVWCLAAWIVLAAVVLAAREAGKVEPRNAVVATRADNGLSRCRAMGAAAADDPACRAAWGAARARFFGRDAR